MRIEIVYSEHSELATCLHSYIESIVAEERLPASVVTTEDQNLDYSIAISIRVKDPAGDELTLSLYSQIVSQPDLDNIHNHICKFWEEFTLRPITHIHEKARIAA